MSDLRTMIKDIQRAVGVTADGVFGPRTAAKVRAALQARDGIEPDGPAVVDVPPSVLEGLDERTLKNIGTLDLGCVKRFADFTRLAKATSATFGCDYVMISGNRSWDEQQALYDQGRSKPGRKVTNARPGHSWHNFKVAADFGVFRAGDYLDSSEASLAAKVHAACSVHARGCGLEWGGNWASLKDTPHYQMGGLPASPTAEHRKVFKGKGSVL